MAKSSTAQPTRQQNLNAASGAAFKRLKEAHLDEWNGYMAEEAKSRGEKWEPKPTEEQKREAALRQLLAEDPALAAKIAAEVSGNGTTGS